MRGARSRSLPLHYGIQLAAKAHNAKANPRLRGLSTLPHARVWDSRRADDRGAGPVICIPGTPGVLRATALGAGGTTAVVFPPLAYGQAPHAERKGPLPLRRVLISRSSAPRGYPGSCAGASGWCPHLSAGPRAVGRPGVRRLVPTPVPSTRAPTEARAPA